ncbi:MAG: hypothetical protein ACEQSR_05770 [Candidatus Methylacidiphilales bacterium]
MSLQIIQGGNGKPAGVFIPINDWEIMKEEYQNLQAWEEPEPTKAEILAGIKEAVEEVKLIKAGKIKAKSLKELLNEL